MIRNNLHKTASSYQFIQLTLLFDFYAMPHILEKFQHLQPFLKEIVTMQSHQLPGSNKAFTYYADGLPGIMYYEAAGGMYLGEEKLPQLIIYGLTVKPIEIIAHGSFKMIVFYLYPHVIHQLFNVNAAKLVDSCMDFDSLPFDGAKELLSLIQNTPHLEAQTEVIARFLSSLVPAAKQLNVVENTLRQLELSNESFSFSTISDDLQVSQRSLQRLFNKNVGISPRMYARISRFNKTLKKMEMGGFNSLTELAHEDAYTDQSHFIRTFKEFTGLTPKEFIARVEHKNE